eukprot:357833-Chlamydomonas_euryale.AAC.10
MRSAKEAGTTREVEAKDKRVRSPHPRLCVAKGASSCHADPFSSPIPRRTDRPVHGCKPAGTAHSHLLLLVDSSKRVSLSHAGKEGGAEGLRAARRLARRLTAPVDRALPRESRQPGVPPALPRPWRASCSTPPPSPPATRRGRGAPVARGRNASARRDTSVAMPVIPLLDEPEGWDELVADDSLPATSAFVDRAQEAELLGRLHPGHPARCGERRERPRRD